MNHDGPIIECKVAFKHGRHGRKRLGSLSEASVPANEGRIPRVSRLVALSIRIKGLIDAGEIGDWAEAARLSHITRARASQIAGLSLLAPDIIEELLHLPPVKRGRDSITERDLRPMVVIADWRKQRRMWREIARSSSS